MKKYLFLILSLLTLLLSTACDSYEIKQTEVGREYQTTGLLALYGGKTGFIDDVKGPGTYYAGVYGSVRKINCEQSTNKETLDSLTKDNIQFKVDVYVRQSANCQTKEAAMFILNNIRPNARALDKDGNLVADAVSDGFTITNTQLYDTYIRPALGEAVRVAIGPYVANDIGTNREKIFEAVIQTFNKSIKDQKPQVVTIYELKLSNLDMPDQLEKANVALAEQTILTEKAKAERLTIAEQEKTAVAKKDLEQKLGEAEGARIRAVSAALRENPEYISLLKVQQLPEIYKAAGEKGNLIIAAPNPIVATQGSQSVVEPAKK